MVFFIYLLELPLCSFSIIRHWRAEMVFLECFKAAAVSHLDGKPYRVSKKSDPNSCYVNGPKDLPTLRDAIVVCVPSQLVSICLARNQHQRKVPIHTYTGDFPMIPRDWASMPYPTQRPLGRQEVSKQFKTPLSPNQWLTQNHHHETFETSLGARSPKRMQTIKH